MAARMAPGARVWRVPVPLLSAAATLAGRRADLNKLAGSLQVDASKACGLLGWRPQISFEAGVDEMVGAFLRAR
jgi:UDP-glucose 4-epimerase